MANVLLDTNILIDRENPNQPKVEVNRLLYAIDKFKYEKFVHPASIEELDKYGDKKQKDILINKLEAYNRIQVRPKLTDDFIKKLKSFSDEGENHKVDNELLFQIYDKRMDFLVTEDRVIYKKSEVLGISNKVFTI